MAAEQLPPNSITARSTQPLAGVFLEDDADAVRYFVDEPTPPAPQPSADALAALSVIGAWSDMDWDELADSLDRIRHASPPTPPIEL